MLAEVMSRGLRVVHNKPLTYLSVTICIEIWPLVKTQLGNKNKGPILILLSCKGALNQAGRWLPAPVKKAFKTRVNVPHWFKCTFTAIVLFGLVSTCCKFRRQTRIQGTFISITCKLVIINVYCVLLFVLLFTQQNSRY